MVAQPATMGGMIEIARITVHVPMSGRVRIIGEEHQRDAPDDHRP